MKKIIKIFFGLILFIILAIIVTSIILISKIKDDTDINNINVVNDNRSVSEVINNKLYNSLDDIETKKDANLLFNSEEIEYLIYPILMELNEKIKVFSFTGVDCLMKDEDITLRVSLKIAYVIKTVISLKVKIDYSLEEGKFALSFKEANLGSIVLINKIKPILKSANIKDIQKALEEKNIFLDIDVDKMMVEMTNDNLEKLVVSFLGSENEDLISLLFDIFIKNDELLKINTGENDLFGAILHLGITEYNSQNNGSLSYSYDFESLKNEVENLLKNNQINTSKLNDTYNFLVRGYDHVDETTKESINNIDYSLLGIKDNKTYDGIIKRDGVTVNNYVNGLFKNKDILALTKMLTGGFMIPDDTLNGVFQTFDFVGYSYALNNYQNSVLYLTFEQLCLTCLDQKIKIDMIININGLRLVLEANFDIIDQNQSGLVVSGNLDSVMIGSFILTIEEETKLVRYLENVITGVDWFSLNSSNKTITLDFTSVIANLITENKLIATILSQSINHQTRVKIEDGYVSIIYALN